MPNFDLTGRVAFVNGGAGGIGKETSRGLAAMGAAVAIADLNGEAARAAAARLTAAGHRVLAFEGDGADRASVERMVAEARQKLGPIDIAVNIVGRAVAPGWDKSDFWAESDASWDWLLRVNLKSHFYLVRAVADDMKARGYGKIVTLAADLGRTGGTNQRNPTVYAAAKAGVIAFTKSIARDLGPFGITVNCVSPGYTEQPDRERHPDAVQEPLPAWVALAIPMRRRAQPSEPADAICFLCSPASDFITGQVISVNGGADMVD